MDPERISDEALLAAFISGDDRAFGSLVRRHEDRIFALCLRMMGDRGDALEASQEAFTSAFRQAHNFRGDSAFGTWLYRIAINASRDLLRKRARTPTPDEVAVERAAEATGSPSLEDQVELRADLTRALSELPEEYRTAVMMHDLGGIPYEEIAGATGAPIGTVKSRISRGRRMLAGSLEQASPRPASKGES